MLSQQIGIRNEKRARIPQSTWTGLSRPVEVNESIHTVVNVTCQAGSFRCPEDHGERLSGRHAIQNGAVNGDPDPGRAETST
jgi:hypothetical protein